MALALAAAIRRGERTCVAVAEEAVRRARTSKLNAFARVDAEATTTQKQRLKGRQTRVDPATTGILLGAFVVGPLIAACFAAIGSACRPDDDAPTRY